MFPSASRQYHLQQGHPYSLLTPNDQVRNRSGHLPYFKRFPHNKYKSEQRKRQKVSIAPKEISPPKKSHEIKFFKQENEDLAQQHRYNFSSSIINRKSSKPKPRILRNALYKHIHNQQEQMERNQSNQRQKTKFRVKTQQANKNELQSRFSVKQVSVSKPKALTAKRVLQSQKGILTQLQMLQIGQYQQIFYYGQNCAKKKTAIKEMTKQDGGYIWARGDHVAYRYQILDELGQGSFGQVLKCFDHKRKTQVAVKIVKDNQKFAKQARIEIKILNYIKAKDPLSAKNCIEIRDYFTFRQRMCMTFDLLSINLYELTKNNGYYGFPLDLIRRFALQLLNAIFFLHKNNIIHADLKPENVLLKQSHKSGIKVIDFGSSCYENQTIYTYIQSRYYRAPEVILGMPYNRKIDIWSFGCIIAELHLGYPLFAGQNQHEQMCYLLQVLGKPPQALSDTAKRWKVFFNSQNQLRPHEKKVPPSSKTLNQALQNPNDNQFVDFLRSCFQWVPDKRAQALELLKSEWILKGLPQEIMKQHLQFIREQQRQLAMNQDQSLYRQPVQNQRSQIQKKRTKKGSFIIKQRNRFL